METRAAIHDLDMMREIGFQRDNQGEYKSRAASHLDCFRSSFVMVHTGVTLRFEKLHIANTQHGKNCVSSPAAKTTISTDLPKICPGHSRAGLQTAHRPF